MIYFRSLFLSTAVLIGDENVHLVDYIAEKPDDCFAFGSASPKKTNKKT